MLSSPISLAPHPPSSSSFPSGVRRDPSIGRRGVLSAAFCSIWRRFEGLNKAAKLGKKNNRVCVCVCVCVCVTDTNVSWIWLVSYEKKILGWLDCAPVVSSCIFCTASAKIRELGPEAVNSTLPSVLFYTVHRSEFLMTQWKGFSRSYFSFMMSLEVTGLVMQTHQVVIPNYLCTWQFIASSVTTVLFTANIVHGSKFLMAYYKKILLLLLHYVINLLEYFQLRSQYTFLLHNFWHKHIRSLHLQLSYIIPSSPVVTTSSVQWCWHTTLLCHW